MNTIHVILLYIFRLVISIIMSNQVRSINPNPVKSNGCANSQAFIFPKAPNPTSKVLAIMSVQTILIFSCSRYLILKLFKK
jgi:hypothetical protein